MKLKKFTISAEYFSLLSWCVGVLAMGLCFWHANKALPIVLKVQRESVPSELVYSMAEFVKLNFAIIRSVSFLLLIANFLVWLMLRSEKKKARLKQSAD